MKRRRPSPGILLPRLVAAVKAGGLSGAPMQRLVLAVYGDDPPAEGGASLRVVIQRHNRRAGRHGSRFVRLGDRQQSRWLWSDVTRMPGGGRFAEGAVPRATR